MTTLSSARLSLRKIEETDVPTLFAIVHKNPEIIQYLTWGIPSSVQEMIKRHKKLEQEDAAGTRKRLGIFYNNTIIGSVSLSNIIYTSGRRIKNIGELGYWLSPEYAGQGLATEAAQTMLEYGFETLKLRKIKAACVPENIASQKILEKIHMRHIGTSKDHYFERNRWWDMELYEITVDDWKTKKKSLNGKRLK